MTTKTQTIGLIELTTQRQANNGTQCFHDPIAGCDYLSYESGYVRRRIPVQYARRTTSGDFASYQLNRTRKVLVESTYTPGRFYNRTERILEMSLESRIDIIVRATTNYRKFLKK